MLRANKTLLMAKIEGTYGTDSVPVKSANAFIATNVKVDPIFKTVERLGIHQSGGLYPAIIIGEGVKITFDTEIYPAASANAAPLIDPLLQACAMVKSGGTSVPVVYTQSMSTFGAEKSCSIYVYIDSILHKITGCIGTMKMSNKVNEITKLSFEFTGLYSVAAEDPAPNDATFTTTAPLMLKSAQLLFDSIAMIGTSVDIDLGNSIQKKESWNDADGVLAYYISDQKCTATIDPDADVPSSLDIWHSITTANVGTLALTLEGGSRDVTIAMENCYVMSAPYGERNNILTWQISLESRAALNDATYAPLVLTFT